MTGDGRGDGPYTHGSGGTAGNSFASGCPVPSWLRNSEYYHQYWLSRTSIWTVMA